LSVLSFGGFFLWGGIGGHRLVWGNEYEYFEISMELFSVNENLGLPKISHILNKKEKREKEATICSISLTQSLVLTNIALPNRVKGGDLNVIQNS
jgi:hypothetical protein